jgi:hypothetical protein
LLKASGAARTFHADESGEKQLNRGARLTQLLERRFAVKI